MKLDFLVPGFGKCGTTTLCALLAEHPRIFIPPEKEIGFFAPFFAYGWGWYENFFRDADPGQTWGEGSVFYSSTMFEAQAIPRIVERFPEVRLLFIARHPVARLESYYRELHHSGWFVRVEAPSTIAETLTKFKFLVEDTLYWQRINAFRRSFPDDHIHVLFLEDLVRDPAAELTKCLAFLGLDSPASLARTDRKLNSGEMKLYDSALMRRLRRAVPWLELWRALPDRVHNGLGRRLGLRRPFQGPISWDSASLGSVLERVADDARQFLVHYGKPADFWRLDIDSVSKDRHRRIAA